MPKGEGRSPRVRVILRDGRIFAFPRLRIVDLMWLTLLVAILMGCVRFFAKIRTPLLPETPWQTEVDTGIVLLTGVLVFLGIRTGLLVHLHLWFQDPSCSRTLRFFKGAFYCSIFMAPQLLLVKAPVVFEAVFLGWMSVLLASMVAGLALVGTKWVGEPTIVTPNHDEVDSPAPPA